MKIVRDIEDTELSNLFEGDTFYHGENLYLKIRPVRNGKNILVNAINLNHAHPINFGEKTRVKPVSVHIVVEK
jgi:hypothetical protein